MSTKQCYNRYVTDFRILGPLEAAAGDRPLVLGGQKQRALLALLLLDAGRVVSTDRLVNALWGEDPPRTAITSLQNFVSQLRKLLGPDLLETKVPGYRLRIAAGDLDLDRFRALVESARAAPLEERTASLREALGLWRGPALADFAFEAWTSSGAADAGFLNSREVALLFDEHRRGAANHGRLLYAIAMFLPILIGVLVGGQDHLENIGVLLIAVFIVFTIRLHMRAHQTLIQRLRIEEALREGVDVAMDAYPYLAGSCSLLQFLPKWC